MGCHYISLHCTFECESHETDGHSSSHSKSYSNSSESSSNNNSSSGNSSYTNLHGERLFAMQLQFCGRPLCASSHLPWCRCVFRSMKPLRYGKECRHFFPLQELLWIQLNSMAVYNDAVFCFCSISL